MTIGGTVIVQAAAVNAAPQFELCQPRGMTVWAGSSEVEVVGFAHSLTKGNPTNGVDLEGPLQTVTFHVATPGTESFFVEPPTVDLNGTLRFLIADGAAGNVSLVVTLVDDAGTAEGGTDTSIPHVVPLHIASYYAVIATCVLVFLE